MQQNDTLVVKKIKGVTEKRNVYVLNNIINLNDAILVNGSRGMAMEEVVNKLL